MALYSLQISTISRRNGSDAVRHAAYRAGECLRSDRTGRKHDYTAKQDVRHREIVSPQGSPSWVQDRTQLWNRVEARERRYDARLAREVYIAIPREIPPERRPVAIREFVQEHFIKRGMIADFAIHEPEAKDNGKHPHAHILLTSRPIVEGEFGLKEPAWNHPREVRRTRLAWERHANTALLRAGSLDRVDARSLKSQREALERQLNQVIDRGDRATARRLAERVAELDREPEPALGRAASEMEKKGRRTRRGTLVRAVRARNLANREKRRQVRWRETRRRLRQRALRVRIERAVSRLGLSPVHFMTTKHHETDRAVRQKARETSFTRNGSSDRTRDDVRSKADIAIGQRIEETLAYTHSGSPPQQDPNQFREEMRCCLDRLTNNAALTDEAEFLRKPELERE